MHQYMPVLWGFVAGLLLAGAWGLGRYAQGKAAGLRKSCEAYELGLRDGTTRAVLLAQGTAQACVAYAGRCLDVLDVPLDTQAAVMKAVGQVLEEEMVEEEASPEVLERLYQKGSSQ